MRPFRIRALTALLSLALMLFAAIPASADPGDGGANSVDPGDGGALSIDPGDGGANAVDPGDGGAVGN